MRGIRAVLGLWLASGATVLWILALFAGGPEVWAALGLMVILVGFSAAAWSVQSARQPLGVFGFLAVAVGITMFYRADLWSGIYNIAGLSFGIGAVLAAAGVWRDSVAVQRTGLLVAALASLVWVYADIGAWWWQPGNMLMAVACVLAVWGTSRR